MASAMAPRCASGGLLQERPSGRTIAVDRRSSASLHTLPTRGSAAPAAGRPSPGWPLAAGRTGGGATAAFGAQRPSREQAAEGVDTSLYRDSDGAAPPPPRRQTTRLSTPPVYVGQELDLDCARLALEGKGGAGRRQGGVVVRAGFLKADGCSVGALGGSGKERYAEARKLASLAPHHNAVPPPCPYFGPCGGCTLQSLSYEAQLQEKRNQVEQTLRRVGRLGPALDQIAAATAAAAATAGAEGTAEAAEPGGGARVGGVAPTVGCRDSLAYRNKSAGTDDDGADAGGGGDGLTGFAEGGYDTAAAAAGGSHTILYGRSYIHDTLGGQVFRISPGSFFQTNSRQAEVLYDIVRQAAALRPGRVDTLLDLYCGTGTIGLSMAAECREVVGVDVVESAIEDARRNAAINSVRNAVFITADIDRLAPRDDPRYASGDAGGGVSTGAAPPPAAAAGLPAHPDVVIVDPARGGLSGGSSALLVRCGARRVVYVSCNVATQARDLDRLVNGPAAPFRLVSVQPVDLFPHTDHVETVAVLERR
ncbi:putative RNA methyltransferase CT0009 [Tetrabaena socialis]|uniref:Putative RNA methyltransferase CT0009 n=1 Tax=Tetrabaena socialis TaxID=47790 RepID=A0A2J8A7N7_9CHLO|nr:putative RNA methyltransferase CT0009 [Tetrabaena socialis]|eukprot:PNH08515.1 putative RNA methyltransferase CT0009 [Tetrabaena socialis]